MVNAAAQRLPKYSGTKLSVAYIAAHQSSWQAHLERISTFLQHGEGVWWRKEGDDFIFLGADTDADAQQVGLNLLHFRSSIA